MKNLIFISVIFFVFNGCKLNDTSSDLDLSIHHLEELFYPSNELFDVDSLYSLHGDFWLDYTNGVLNLPNNNSFNDSLKKIRTERSFVELINQMQKQYSDFDIYKKELSIGFGNYQTFFPDKIVPKIVTIFSALNYPIVVTDSVLAISLEMFLGKKYYEKWAFKYPFYMHQKFQPEYMTTLALRLWLETEYTRYSGNFLSQIIHNGKLNYVLKQMTNKDSHIIMGYSKDQLDWCIENEYSIWKFLISEGLLYTNDQFEILKYTNPSPSSGRMPSESPGQLVNWVGWQIVDRFMSNNPEISINELMMINDAQFILQKSKYKP